MKNSFFLVKTEHFTNIFLSLQTKVVKYYFVNVTFDNICYSTDCIYDLHLTYL